MGTQKTKTEAI